MGAGGAAVDAAAPAPAALPPPFSAAPVVFNLDVIAVIIECTSAYIGKVGPSRGGPEWKEKVVKIGTHQ